MTRRLLPGVALLCLGWYLLMPPAAITVPTGSVPGPAVLGAIHVHSDRSDGTGTVEQIAAQAARAGLRFVVVTDHGDATRDPLPPAYRSGVLCLDAVEISTSGGHVVAIGLPRAPYPLGGEPRDVVEDVHRLGGIAIAAHPASAKPELAWSGWDTPVDGFEWLNGDSEWRDESRLSLLRALVTYPWRGAESITSLLDRPDALLERWDALSRTRPLVALAGSDAHARLGLRSFGEPYDSGMALPVPSYAEVFRAFAIGLPGVSLSGDAAADAARVVDAIRAGAVYTAVTGLAAPLGLSFTARSGGRTASMGGLLAIDGPLYLQVEAQAPPQATLRILRNGRAIADVDGLRFDQNVGAEAGVYRVEVHLPGAPGAPAVPLLLSNPIYIGLTIPEQPAAPAAPAIGARAETGTRTVYGDGAATGWSVEHSARSLGAIDVLARLPGTAIGYRFALGGGMAEQPYSALVRQIDGGLAGYSALSFTGSASRPLRVSVQLRAPGNGGERWHRSIVLEPGGRRVRVAFDDMRPRGATTTPVPDLARVSSLLFVIDTTNAAVGDNGEIVLDDLVLHP